MMGATGRVQLLSSSHSIINKENIVMLKQAVAPLCRLHLRGQTKGTQRFNKLTAYCVWSGLKHSNSEYKDKL